MSRLTTHVLDTARGVPAAGLAIRLTDDAGALVTDLVTDTDGRGDFGEVPGGTYLLAFDVGSYFGSTEFLDVVPVRFRVADDGKYHVPLLVSPWSYSTYRGS